MIEGTVAIRSSVQVREQLPLDSVNLDLVDSFTKACEFMYWLGERHGDTDVLGVDTESGGLVYWRDKLRLVQFGDPHTGWAIPWDLWGGLALEALNKYTGRIGFHNAPYDVNVLRHYTRGQWHPDWSRIEDTTGLAHIDDSTRTKKLKSLSGILIDPRAASAQSVLDDELAQNKWTWDTIPIVRSGAGSSYWIYAALDPVLTRRLFDHFRPTRAQFNNVYELEIGTMQCVTDMMYRGVKVDLDYCRRMSVTIEDAIRQLRQWVYQSHGIANATSNQQCIRRLHELGRTLSRRTKGGDVSLDKEQIQALLIGEDIDPEELDKIGSDNLHKIPGNDLAQAILDIRRGERYVGTYFRSLELYADPQGYVHPSIWTLGARTGRQSISNPPLHQLPRKDPTVRDAVIPTDEDFVIITCDADQIEMRMAAHFSRDEGLRRAFMETDDFFNTVASQAWGDVITKTDPRRQTMKNGCYGQLYMASIVKIAQTAGVPVHIMEYVMSRYNESFPGIKKYQREILKEVREQLATGVNRTYTETPLGRRLYADPGKEYALANYKIQGHAAEFLKAGICALYSAGLGPYISLSVHDEIVADAPRKDKDEIKCLIEDTLNNLGNNYFVPITWSADVMNKRWGDKYRKPTQTTQNTELISTDESLVY